MPALCIRQPDLDVRGEPARAEDGRVDIVGAVRRANDDGRSVLGGEVH